MEALSPHTKAHDTWADRSVESLTQDWQEAVLAHVADYDRFCTPLESAQVLRSFIKTGLLRFTDMRDRPERFFAAHRLLASRILGGFGIRFTVQYNLFAGSILGLGSSTQVAQMEKLQEQGELGCFALTEVGAGVLSGFIVETTATWDPSKDGFVITTPTPRAEKNWISQGMCADWVVVFAQLVLDGKSYGPHPFLLRMRTSFGGITTLTEGITITDMGPKTVANDLDNARLRFDHVFAPRTSLLSRFASVTPEGVYHQVDPNESMRIEVIGQRLITGRLAIAESSLVAVRQLIMKTKSYADSKQVNGISGPQQMSKLPHLEQLFTQAHKELTTLEVFTASVEARLAEHLRANTIPDTDLVEAISVAKVRNIEMSTFWEHRLEQEVGSYALMAESGFIYKDMFLCSKFAEGDSRILMLKMARDTLKSMQKRGYAALLKELCSSNPALRARAWAAFKLARALAMAPSVAEGFEREWEKAYALAEKVCDLHVARRPEPKEIARILKSYPSLMDLIRDPLLVSRL